MDKQQIQQAASRGLGDIVEVLYEADILHAGWEMDNKAWIAKTVSGNVVALTTDHGGDVRMGSSRGRRKAGRNGGCGSINPPCSGAVAGR